MAATAEEKPVYLSDHAAVDLGGIVLSNGQAVLPGLCNSFALRKRVSFYAKYRAEIMQATFALTIPGIFALLVLIAWALGWVSDRRFDEMAMAQFNFGDVVALKPQRRAAPLIEIDEVFGNEYVKDKDKMVDGENDPRIGGAMQAFASGVTPPIDLSPDIVPEYSAAARSKGLQGKVFLEIIVADDGSVLRVRVAKGVDPLIDNAAVAAYRRKRWAPSRGPDGKAVTVKFIQPVNFVLQ